MNASINNAAIHIYCEFKSQLLQKTHLSTSYVRSQLEEAQRQLVLAIKPSKQEDNTMYEKPYHELRDVISAFCDAMATQNIAPPSHIDADGKLHRFHVEGDKTGSRNGWYVLYPYPSPRGLFGSWKTGVSSKWSAQTTSHMSLQEQIQAREELRKLQHQRRADLQSAQLAVAKTCTGRWQRYRDADPRHAYLARKQIKSYCARQVDDILALPIVDTTGKLWSLQYITSEGDKILCFQGAKKSHFIPVHKTLQSGAKILICEGFATGASLADIMPDACVIAAIDAGNLEPVAVAVRQLLPHNDIVICADDDRAQANNVGLIKAKQAALAAQARWVKPQWPADAPLELSDFNDWVCWFNNKEDIACFSQL